MEQSPQSSNRLRFVTPYDIFGFSQNNVIILWYRMPHIQQLLSAFSGRICQVCLIPRSHSSKGKYKMNLSLLRTPKKELISSSNTKKSKAESNASNLTAIM